MNWRIMAKRKFEIARFENPSSDRPVPAGKRAVEIKDDSHRVGC